MFLSKIWIVLIGAVGVLATGVSLLAPRALDHAVTRKDEELLRRGYVVADLYLEAFTLARRRRVAEIGRDAPLAARLAAQATARDAGARTAALNEIRAKLEGFNSKLNAGIALVTDDQGLVVMRMGAGEKNPPDSVAQTALVRKALSGEDDRDTWAVEGRLFRVVGAPVTGPGSRVVGTVVFGFEFNDAMAAAIQARAGSEVAFFLNGRRLAKSMSLDDGPLGEVPGLLKKLPALAKSPKPSDPTPLAGGRFFAMIKGLGGEAAEQGAVYALLLPHKRPAGIFEFVFGASSEEWRGVPWPGVIGAFVVVLVLAFVFLAIEAERPLKKLIRETRELAEGAGARIDDRRYGGKFGSLARAFNEVLRKGGRAAAPPPEAFLSSSAGNVTKEINMILGGVASPKQFELPTEPPAVQGTMIDLQLPEVAAAKAASGAAGAPAARPNGGAAEKPARAPVRASTEKPPVPPPVSRPPAAPPPAPAMGASRSAAPPPPSTARSAGGKSGARPMPEPNAPDTDEMLAAPTAVQKASSSAAKPPPAAKPPAARGFNKGIKPPTLVQTTSKASEMLDDVPMADVQPAVEHDDHPGEATVVAEVPETLLRQSARDDSVLDEAVHYRQIFEQFLDTKERCGESVANLTYEKFVTKLEANREQIVSRYACKSVRFQVYVKDGKAALKATPVKA